MTFKHELSKVVCILFENWPPPDLHENLCIAFDYEFFNVVYEKMIFLQEIIMNKVIHLQSYLFSIQYILKNRNFIFPYLLDVAILIGRYICGENNFSPSIHF